MSEPSVNEGSHMTPRMLVPSPVRLCDHSQVTWVFAFLEDNWEKELGFGFPRLFPDLSVFLLEDQGVDSVWELEQQDDVTQGKLRVRQGIVH